MVLFLNGLVLTPLNKMVVQNENIVTFLMLSAPFSFLPFFLSAFGVRPSSLLCAPLIVFLHQLHITNPPYLTDYHCSFALATLYEPYTYRNAHTDPLWQQAINEDLDALYKNHIWDMIDLPLS